MFNRFSEGCRSGDRAGVAPSGAAAVRIHHPGSPALGRSRGACFPPCASFMSSTRLAKPGQKDLMPFMQAFLGGMVCTAACRWRGFCSY